MTKPAYGRRRQITCRFRIITRDKLEVAAKQSGVSVSEEIERRLEESFWLQNLMISLGGEDGKKLFDLQVAKAGQRLSAWSEEFRRSGAKS